MNNEQPSLPYGGANDPNSGFAGSDTSEDRAREDDRTGRTKRRQADTLAALNFAKADGLTYAELGQLMGWHHGQSSGVLSVLHQAKKIARLKARRNRQRIYVALSHVGDRPTDEAARTQTHLLLDGMAELLDRAPRCGHELPFDYTEGCWSCEVQDILRVYDNRH